MSDDAAIVFVAYGTTSRIVKNAVKKLRADGVRAGLIRPITLWPYPHGVIRDTALRASTRAFVVVEMSLGQMVEDVERSVRGKKPVHFFGRTAGVIPQPKEIVGKAYEVLEKEVPSA